MASRMQDMNVRLSYLIHEKVSSYSVNGTIYLSQDRDEYINMGINFLWNIFYDQERLLVRKARAQTNAQSQQGIDLLVDFKFTSQFLTSADVFLEQSEANISGVGVKVLSGYRIKQIYRVASQITSGESTVRNYEILERQDIPLVFTDAPKYKPTVYNPKAFWTQNKTQTLNYVRLMPNPNLNAMVYLSYLTYPRFGLRSADTDDIQFNASYDEDILRLAFAYVKLDDGDFASFSAIVQEVLSHYQITKEIVVGSIQREEANKTQP